MDKQKYVEALKHESPDVVLGSLMDELGYPDINGIADACDVAQSTSNQDDLDQIETNQPMFYNYKSHRLVNKADVLNILNQLKK